MPPISMPSPAPAPRPFLHIPDTVSPQARRYLESLVDPALQPPSPAPDDIMGWRRLWEEGEATSQPLVKVTLDRWQPIVEERRLGGVPVLEVRPRGWKDNGQALVYTHGGAYIKYSARSLLRSAAPVAEVTGLRVFSIDYTVAPTAKWQQVTDQVVAVWKALADEGLAASNVAIYGDSAGGALAAGATLKMRNQGLPMPAALVLWSPWADITDRGDTAVTLKDAEPTYLYDRHLKSAAAAYADPADQRHPYVSPVYAGFSPSFPPTLIQGGTKEIFLSHFVRLYRAIDDGGGHAVLDLYEGMPHVFQNLLEMADSPETRAALGKMKTFLNRRLAPTAR